MRARSIKTAIFPIRYSVITFNLHVKAAVIAIIAEKEWKNDLDERVFNHSLLNKN